MTHKTKAIILRSIRYGETSLVITAFTELFGIQTYIMNGVRTSKPGSKAAQFQPGALLHMEVYHNELKAMNRIKESSWHAVYKNIFSDVISHSIAIYLVELTHKLLKQPEADPDLFGFFEEVLLELDNSPREVAANIPLFFTLHLPQFFGFRITDNEGSGNYLDLMEGRFSSEEPSHEYFLTGNDAEVTSDILRTRQVNELGYIHLHRTQRRHLLENYMTYYALHVPDFGKMKTLDIITL